MSHGKFGNTPRRHLFNTLNWNISAQNFEKEKLKWIYGKKMTDYWVELHSCYQHTIGFCNECNTYIPVDALRRFNVDTTSYQRWNDILCLLGYWVSCNDVIQLKMFIFEKVWNKFKQNFNSYNNISFSSFRGIYWLNTLGHYVIII